MENQPVFIVVGPTKQWMAISFPCERLPTPGQIGQLELLPGVTEVIPLDGSDLAGDDLPTVSLNARCGGPAEIEGLIQQTLAGIATVLGIHLEEDSYTELLPTSVAQFKQLGLPVRIPAWGVVPTLRELPQALRDWFQYPISELRDPRRWLSNRITNAILRWMYLREFVRSQWRQWRR